MAWGGSRRSHRVTEYRAAGADQVVLRFLGVDDIAATRARLAESLIG